MSRPPPKDYEHPPTAAAVITTEWILLGTAALLISARLFLRLKINRQGLTISDGFICSAWSAAVAYNSFDILYMKIGALKIAGPLGDFHTDPVTMQKLLLCLWASLTPFYSALYLSKAAILSFYLQICPESSRAKRNVIWIAVYYAGAAYVSTMALVLFLCYPVWRNWTLDDNDACPLWAGAMLYQIAWALHFSSDIFVFFLPFLLLHRLRMRRLVKIGVYCTFTLGLINIIFSLTGFITLTLSLDHRIADSPFTLIELWCAIDCNIGVIVATLPSLRPYLRMIRQGSSARPRKQLEGHALADYYLKRRLARIGRPKAKDTTLKSETNVTTTVAREDWEPEHDIPSRAASRGGAAATEMGSEVDLVEQRG